MAITLISQELFDPTISGYANYNSVNTGAFNSFTGHLSASALGPQSFNTTSGEPVWGYSAKSLITTTGFNQGIFNFNDGPIATGGIIAGWFNMWYDNANSANHGTVLFDVVRNQGASSWLGTLSLYNNNLYLNFGSIQISSSLILPHQWNWLAVAWYNTGGNTRVIKVYQKTLGQPTASLLYTYVNASAFSGQPYTASAGFANLGGSTYMLGRMGATSLYSIDSASFSNNLLPADIKDPPIGPYTWYVNPGLGNDTNDGLFSSSAWQSETKLRTELNLCQGVFGAISTGSGLVGNGDKIVLDTSVAPFKCSQYGIGLNKPGLWLTSAKSSSFVQGSTLSYANITPYEVIPNISWSLVPGKTNTYKVTGSVTSVFDCYVWENNNWLFNPLGTTYNSVSNSLETTSGSFFQDGINVYIHPFGNTNPITDGKTYIKSFLLTEPQTGTTGSAAINIGNILPAPNILVEQMFVSKSATWDNTSGLWPSYDLVIDDGYGNILIQNCYFNYGGKHTCGITFGTSTNNCYVTFSQVQAEQSLGGNSFIVFSGNAATGSNTVLFTGCTTLASNYTIGSAVGNINGNSMYGHNNSGFNQFQNILITNCNLIGGSIFLFGGACANTSMIFTTGSGQLGANGTCSVDRCLIGLPYANGPLICKNSIVTVTGSFAIEGILNNYQSTLINSPMTVSNCTFDLTNMQTTPLYQHQSLYTYGVGGSIFFVDNIFISPTNDITLYNAFPLSSIFSDYNIYVLSGSTSYMGSASFGSASSYQSFNNLQSLGLELHSKNFVNANSIGLNSNYQPQAGSPAIGNGIQESYYYDFTGQTFPSRLTIGAYEYIVQLMTTMANYGVAAATSGHQTVNDVQLTHALTVKDSVLHETVFNDPYILSLMEHMDYLMAKKLLTPQMERTIRDEISGRICYLRK